MSAQVIEPLIGKTFAKAKQIDKDEIAFLLDDGRVAARFFYNPDCCADCQVEDISGDLGDLCGSPITMAEFVCSKEQPPESKIVGECPNRWEHHDDETPCDQCKAYLDAPLTLDESNTWTFVKLATAKGYVTIRWFGSSNGYYSEQPSFQDVLAADESRAQAEKNGARNLGPRWTIDHDEHIFNLHQDFDWRFNRFHLDNVNRKI